MNPFAALISALPRSGDGQPPSPPPLDAAALQQLREDVLGPAGGWRGSVQSALAARLQAEGEAPLATTPWKEALLFSPEGEASGFAARTTERQDLNPAERTLKVAAWARATAEILFELAGEHPELLSRIHRQDGRLVVEPLAAVTPSIVVVERARAWLMTTPAQRPVPELAWELGSALATGRFGAVDPDQPQLFDAPAAVVVDRRFLQVARAGYRRSGLRGPWMAVAQSSRGPLAPPMELIGASSAVVDPALLPELAGRILARVDDLLEALPDGTFQTLGRDLTRAYVDSWRSLEHGQRAQPDGHREEALVLHVPGRGGHARLAWAVSRIRGGAPVLALRGDRPVLMRCRDGEGAAAFSARFEEAAAAEDGGLGLVHESLRPAVRQATSPAARALLLRSLRVPLGIVEGPLGWLDDASRSLWIEHAPDARWPLHAGIGAPPGGRGGPGGLSVTAAPEGDGLGLTVVGSGELSSNDRLQGYGQELARLLR